MLLEHEIPSDKTLSEIDTWKHDVIYVFTSTKDL